MVRNHKCHDNGVKAVISKRSPDKKQGGPCPPFGVDWVGDFDRMGIIFGLTKTRVKREAKCGKTYA